jgi:VWFA-related protein
MTIPIDLPRRFARLSSRVACAAVLAALGLVSAGEWRLGAQSGGGAPNPGPGAAASQAGAAQAPAPAKPEGQQDQQPARPIFKGGANAVRVDVFVTKNGVPVEDLKADEFELLEDNARQTVDAFEHVKIENAGTPETRVEPRSIREGNQMAADPRARVFILFLDVYHVHRAASNIVTRPLMNLLNRVVGDQDLIALMAPEMSATDITFTRRTDQVANMLASSKWWGQRGQENLSDDPVEQQYMICYPNQESGRVTSTIAQEMIERRREKSTLDALQGLVRHLRGIREERKAILLVSEGWRLFKPDPSFMSASTRPPTLGVGPDGRLGTVDRSNPGGVVRTKCDQDRMLLSSLDNERQFRDILDEANLANASFYPVEPRGLTVFDNDIGPNTPPSISADFAMLTARHDTLRVVAENTDGIAVLDSNDIDKGLRRVVSDLSSYYLLGYTSTNSKADGRYRAIKVRVKRPGVEVRSRRGYRAPSASEAAALVAAASAAAPIDPAVAAISKTLATLEGSSRDVPLRVTVSPGYWTPPADAAKANPTGSEPALWILGEVDSKAKSGEDWSQGGDADVSIAGKDGSAIVQYRVPMPAGTSRFLTRFPRTLEDVWLDPGAYSVRVRVTPASGGLPITETTRFDVTPPAGGSGLQVGQPIYIRRAAAAAASEAPTTDRRFRRTERIVVQISLSMPADAVSAELVNRSGKGMALPVAAAVVEKDGVRWARAELALAPLAIGDYVIRITTEKGDQKIQMLAPFRIVP